jgi:putative membrane protein
MPLKLGKLIGIHPYGWLIQLGILILFFLVIFWVLKSSKPKESALDILNRRYANGELTKKEYQKLKKDIFD